MAKQLKLWNGRGWCCHNPNDPRWKEADHKPGAVHINIAAYSRADAARLIREYRGYEGGSLDGELRDYFSPCWGNSMKDITPERGIWAEFERGKPERII